MCCGGPSHSKTAQHYIASYFHARVTLHRYSDFYNYRLRNFLAELGQPREGVVEILVNTDTK
jgi:hypothetical protein